MGQLLHQALASASPARFAECAQGDLADRDWDAKHLAAPAVFQARTCRRRCFLTQRDADAYDAGVAEFRSGHELTGPINTPRSNGYFDAECAYSDTRA